MKQEESFESRVFVSPAAPSRWNFSRVPVAWVTEPRRNIVAGLVAGVVSLPLSIGTGAIVAAPFGAEFVTFGVLAALYGAAFLGLIAVLAGARGVAIYEPCTLVSFVIAAAAADVLVGAAWLPRDDPFALMSALFLMMAMAGAFQVAFALARLPRLVKFIPTPVVAGFQNAASIAICLSQLHLMLGLAQRPAMSGWLGAMSDVRPLQLVLGLVTLALVFWGRVLIKKVPPLVTGLLGGTAIYYALGALGFSADLGDVLGRISVHVPDGRELAGIMAMTQLPGFWQALPKLVLGAGSIAVVASLDVLISAKVVENLSGQRGNSTRELRCIGMANTLAPLLGGLVGSISTTASTANYRSGARNALSLLSHGVFFLLIVVLLAPLVGMIPKVVIAALVLYVGIQLFDRWSLRLVGQVARGRTVNWHGIVVDIAIILLVTAVALAGEIVLAVVLGIVIAIVVFTIRMSQGMIRNARYGDVLHSRRTREAADIDALTANGRRILVLDLEGALFFASAEELHNRVDSAMAEGVRYVVLDIARVTEVDSTGAQILVQTAQRMKAAGVQMLLCGKDERSRTAGLLRDHGVSDVLTRERFFPDADRALEWCENHLLVGLRSRIAVNGDHPFEQLDIVQGMSATEQRVFLDALERREYPAGKTVFEQGEEGDALYVIVRGSASVHMQLAAGDVRLVTFSSGTVFGEMALLDRQLRSATVTADEALACYVLAQSRFDKLGLDHPRIAMTILANMAREMSLRMRRANRALLDQG